MTPYFMNVDLDIESRTKLDVLASSMGKNVIVMHCGRIAKKRHLLALESAREHRGPDATIHALCDVVDRLSPAMRQRWDSAKKVFDVGYELRSTERYSRFTLRSDTLQRVVKLSASLAVTYYRGDETEPGVPPKRLPAAPPVGRKKSKRRAG
jgi:hypothetical protein